MTDWSGSLARAFATYRKTSGSSGSSGSTKAASRAVNGLMKPLAGTTSLELLVPVVPSPEFPQCGTAGTETLGSAVPGAAAQQTADSQDSTQRGTSGTAGTAEIESIDSSSGTSTTVQAAAEFDERAGLIEDGTGVPREWAEGFARLSVGLPPEGFSQPRWQQVLDDGGRFLDEGWAQRAAAVGWSVLDVFGVHPSKPNARFDSMGLVPLIGGGKIIDIKPNLAVIRMPSGNSLTYYLRRESKEAVTLWELASDNLNSV